GLYTANAAENARAIIALATSQPEAVTAVVLDVDRLDIVTITILDALESLDRELGQLGIVLHLARLPEHAVAVARKTPWFEGLEKAGRVHATVDEGLAASVSGS
ncbi:MAG TPA: sulfate transporter, partial [Microbacterium sp.]|nr:sulfate transporter [Microbacterium sp.]